MWQTLQPFPWLGGGSSVPPATRLAPNFNGVDQYATVNIPVSIGDTVEFEFIAPSSYPSNGAFLWDNATAFIARAVGGGGFGFLGASSVTLDGNPISFGDPLPTDNQQHKIVITSSVNATIVTVGARSNATELAYFPIFNLKVNDGAVYSYVMDDGWSNNPTMLNSGSGANGNYINATEDMWISIALPEPEILAVTRVLSGTSPTYIVAGDSKRENPSNNMYEYYTQQFSKIGANVIYQAKSGMTGEQFRTNTDANINLNNLISAIPGDGSTTVVEYSFGANDVNAGATVESLRDTVVNTFNAILAQKPNTTFLLVSGDGKLGAFQPTRIKEAYLLAADIFNCNFIEGAVATDAIFDGDLEPANRVYYQDATHPSVFGSMRLVNYIMDIIVPDGKRPLVTLEEIDLPNVSMPDLTLAVDPVKGFYVSTNGAPVNNDTWRRSLPVAVEPNFEIKFKHQGNRADVICMDEQGGFVVREFASDRDFEGYMHFTIPALTYELRLNITRDNVAEYDALNDQMEMLYKTASNTVVLTQAEINTGLTLNLG